MKSFEEEFIAGFVETSPRSYSLEKDCLSDHPWCRPWTWTVPETWFRADLTPHEMGKVFGKNNYHAMLASKDF